MYVCVAALKEKYQCGKSFYLKFNVNKYTILNHEFIVFCLLFK